MRVVEMVRIVVPNLAAADSDSDGEAAYLWTTGDEPVEYDGDTYEPFPIIRSGIVQGAEINRANITLSIPPDSELARIYNSTVPDVVASVTIFRKQDDSVLVWWRGRVAAARSEGWETELLCESVFTSLRRAGARIRYQRQCRHALYGRGCNVDKADHRTLAECTAVSGNTITLSDIPADDSDGVLSNYLGGIAEYAGVSRFIVGKSGNVLTLWRPLPGLEDALASSEVPEVAIYPGCDRTLETCHAKFDNALNHGGFPWLPDVNPFKFISLW